MPDTMAIIIGSGFDNFADGQGEVCISNRYGLPSAPLKHGKVAGCDVITLARHGEQHTVPPHAINYRANLLALKDAGVDSIIALATVGVITDVRQPGEMAVPEQVLDYTWGRDQTVYDGRDGQVEHIDFSQPFTASLRAALLGAANTAAIDCFNGGVYATTQGPRLETAAEIKRYKRDGADFVGMTVMPEAAIARELELHYACLALVVNKAAGLGDTPLLEEVDASTAIARENAKKVLRAFFAEAGQ